MSLIAASLLGRPPLTWIPVQTNRLALSQSARFAKQAQPARGYLRIPATPARGSALGSGSRLRLGWSPAVVYYATTAKCCSNPGIDVSYTELLLSARRFARFRPKLISLHDSTGYLCRTVRHCEGQDREFHKGAWEARRWSGTPEDESRGVNDSLLNIGHVDSRNFGI